MGSPWPSGGSGKGKPLKKGPFEYLPDEMRMSPLWRAIGIIL